MHFKELKRREVYKLRSNYVQMTQIWKLEHWTASLRPWPNLSPSALLAGLFSSKACMSCLPSLYWKPFPQQAQWMTAQALWVTHAHPPLLQHNGKQTLSNLSKCKLYHRHPTSSPQERLGNPAVGEAPSAQVHIHCVQTCQWPGQRARCLTPASLSQLSEHPCLRVFMESQPLTYSRFFLS